MRDVTSPLARHWAPAAAALATFAVVAAVLGVVLAASDGQDAGVTARSVPLSARVVQLRRDEVAQRVEVALTNEAGGTLQVERLRLSAGGFTGGGWVRLDYPLHGAGPTNFISPYGETRCPPSGTPQLGRVRVEVQWHTDADATRRTAVLTPVASRGLLSRILRADCLQKHLSDQVHLAFGPSWRTTGAGADIALHTTIDATLSPGAPRRDLTQVGGSVLYGLAPEPGPDPATPPVPLAALSAGQPTASVPVVVTQARCTPHAKGEVKQPYLFLVWVGDPGTGGTAIPVPVTDADKGRLRAVCAF
jgi:hypothetical protein